MITVVLETGEKRVYNATSFKIEDYGLTLYYLPEEKKEADSAFSSYGIIVRFPKQVAYYPDGVYKEVYDSEYLVDEKALEQQERNELKRLEDKYNN